MDMGFIFLISKVWRVTILAKVRIEYGHSFFEWSYVLIAFTSFPEYQHPAIAEKY